MTRLFLITLLVLSSGPAYAEWMPIGGDAQEGTTIYVDLSTVRRNGDLVKVWYMLDYETVRTVLQFSYLSRKSQAQIDCAEERIRNLAATLFSGNKGNGKLVHTDSDEGEWAPVAPESVGEVLLNLVCRKK
jgi:hypothetical protein